MSARANASHWHDALPEWQRPFNTPQEVVRGLLNPHLTEKGRAWAVPLESLTLPDDPPAASAGRRAWLPAFLRHRLAPDVPLHVADVEPAAYARPGLVRRRPPVG